MGGNETKRQTFLTHPVKEALEDALEEALEDAKEALESGMGESSSEYRGEVDSPLTGREDIGC